MPGFSESLAEFAQEKLTEHGIEIKLQTAVTSFDGDEVMIKRLDVDKDASDDSVISSIQSKTVIWTAGVTPVNTIKRSLFKTDKGKIIIDKNLEVNDFPGVFAIGDCALFLDPNTQRPFPPTAQIAEHKQKLLQKIFML